MSPKQQRRPLPSLLSLSFFYECNISVGLSSLMVQQMSSLNLSSLPGWAVRKTRIIKARNEKSACPPLATFFLQFSIQYLNRYELGIFHWFHPCILTSHNQIYLQ